jgi:type II secretory pathway pseudopilin PulG
LCWSSFGCAARFVLPRLDAESRRVNRQAVASEAPFYGLRNPNESRNRNRFTSRSGLTLPEMTVVIGIAALMVALTIPAANMLLNSFESESGTKTIISSALASARAIAAKEQRYAGIRFQKRYDPSNPTGASQYIIFIIQDPEIMAFGFKAVEGLQPIKLPDSVGVMDLTIVTVRNMNNPVNPTQIRIDDPINGGNTAIDSDQELFDTTTFSIVFSPAGKLVVHGVRVRNRDGKTDSDIPRSNDDIFNTVYNVETARIASFYQDDYWTNPYAFGPEPSRTSFIIYETQKFKETATNLRWTNYLSRLNRVYINAYTGTIINEK